MKSKKTYEVAFYDLDRRYLGTSSPLPQLEGNKNMKEGVIIEFESDVQNSDLGTVVGRSHLTLE